MPEGATVCRCWQASKFREWSRWAPAKRHCGSIACYSPVATPMPTLTGIRNENEFYRHHYLAEIFAGDI